MPVAFDHGVGAITVQDRGIKLIGVMQMDDKRFKERLIGAIFRRTIVPFVHVCLVEFVPGGFSVVPMECRYVRQTKCH